ncbi:Acetyl esterase/lipase [Actinokineospora alba]|uniref:Acetyl esterase/lipase n=1 Tax=Actinokineospora alba TaxID=504798 RepID=A0A1H0M8X4_9PSEU|nr:acetyl esterase/lipase [Actinokineospora alba]SDI44166.1 Acetyl esterase/lipase [Actinokineospora alba]SDO76751.1 Acetyl esterase/lipase [Actinokineospora alba]
MTTRRVVAAVLAVVVAVLLAIVAFVIVSASIPESLVRVSEIVSNKGVHVVPLGMIGVALAWVAFRVGARKVGAVTGVVALAATVAICVPLVATYRAADRYGADLSLGDYFEGGENTGKPVDAVTVVYNEVDGQALKLDVKVPAGSASGPRPAVVWVHGGGWNAGDRTEAAQWHNWLNDKGYAVFSIDYRLAPPARWDQAPGDVKCAIGWVKTHAARYQVDPTRVMIAGGSAGGNLALLGAYADGRVTPSCAAQDTAVTAVMAFYPAVSLTTTWDHTGYASALRPWIENYTGGTPHQAPERYRFASADTYVRPGLPPTLLMHGDRDHIVPHQGSADLAEKLARAGVEHELITIPWGEHVYDSHWNGWGTQISRTAMDRFLKDNFPATAAVEGG